MNTHAHDEQAEKMLVTAFRNADRRGRESILAHAERAAGASAKRLHLVTNASAPACFIQRGAHDLLLASVVRTSIKV